MKNCTECILDLTDACPRGAGRAVDDEMCDEFVPREIYEVNKNESWQLGYKQGRADAIDEFLEQCKTFAVRGVFSPIAPQGCERYVFDDGMFSVWLDDIENLAEQLKEQNDESRNDPPSIRG